MKNILLCMTILVVLPSAKSVPASQAVVPVSSAENLIVVTLDGFRWQEIFEGADAALINNPEYTPDAETIKLQYWADDTNERRRLLMPFFWSVIARQGSAVW